MTQETRIIVFTGAGVSADSGINTFRDKNGLWENFKIDDICNYYTWEKNAKEVHAFYSDRRKALYETDTGGNRLVKPNRIHEVMAGWQNDFNTTILTQNVDDLHECAGSEVTHLHGFLDAMECVQCGNKWNVNGASSVYGETKCPRCGSERVKPGVVFFNEGAPEYQKLYSVFNSLNENDVIVVAGCSCAVIPFDIYLRQYPGIKVWCNTDRYIEGTGKKVFDHQMIGRASEVADDLDYLIRKGTR